MNSGLNNQGTEVEEHPLHLQGRKQQMIHTKSKKRTRNFTNTNPLLLIRSPKQSRNQKTQKSENSHWRLFGLETEIVKMPTP